MRAQHATAWQVCAWPLRRDAESGMCARNERALNGMADVQRVPPDCAKGLRQARAGSSSPDKARLKVEQLVLPGTLDDPATVHDREPVPTKPETPMQQTCLAHSRLVVFGRDEWA